ncbi:hypothetical protein KA529_01870 [Candidatus Saccharibacteria bacterium]|nr:hypothetical protein [Candidatus Saccharibacteria bacterium]
MEKNNKSATVGAVLLVAGIAVGGMIGYAYGNDNDGDNGKTENKANSGDAVAQATSDAATARVRLNNALQEHVNLASETLRDVYDGNKNATAAVGSLDKNSEEVAGIVGDFYGDKAGEQFLEIWRDHIGFFADYTTAAKKGDKKAMDQSLSDLAGYGEQASQFFAGANENLPADAVKPLLETHKDLVIATVNAYGAGDYKQSYAKQTEAADQSHEIADALGVGTLKLKK